MNQLLSGHTLLNGHRSKINTTVSELCEACNVIENTDHYLFHCKKYKKEREQLENRVEDILNGAGLNEVADINLSVLVGVVENACATGMLYLRLSVFIFHSSLCLTDSFWGYLT